MMMVMTVVMMMVMTVVMMMVMMMVVMMVVMMKNAATNSFDNLFGQFLVGVEYLTFTPLPRFLYRREVKFLTPPLPRLPLWSAQP